MELPVKQRIYSIDLLRGLVMIIMALDHTRDMFHHDAMVHSPLDLQTTTVYLFFTRWITHYCAPVFVFLAGTSIYLQSLRKSKNELSLFLLTRGVWLMFVDLIIITFAWTFDPSFHLFVMQTLWAIGSSMFIMAIIIRLPYKLIFALGLLIVFGHNVFDYIDSTHHGFFWDLTRNGAFAVYPITDGHKLIILYPFVPWLGLMMVGYCFGKIYNPLFNAINKKRILIGLGLGLILFFVALRFLNVYGDPVPWTTQRNFVFTLLSFLNVHKYPPSLLYMCIMIGPALLFLYFFENTNNKLTQAISVYGRVPFFYYVIHFFVLHTLCMVLFLARGHSFFDVAQGGMTTPRFVIPGEGYSLPIVYIIWLSVVFALYPICKWFSELKKRKNYWWLSYL